MWFEGEVMDPVKLQFFRCGLNHDIPECPDLLVLCTCTALSVFCETQARSEEADALPVAKEDVELKGTP